MSFSRKRCSSQIWAIIWMVLFISLMIVAPNRRLKFILGLCEDQFPSSNIKNPASQSESEVLTSCYASLPCSDYMLKERNHLSITRRAMKKQIVYLNERYGGHMGNLIQLKAHSSKLKGKVGSPFWVQGCTKLIAHSRNLPIIEPNPEPNPEPLLRRLCNDLRDVAEFIDLLPSNSHSAFSRCACSDHNCEQLGIA